MWGLLKKSEDVTVGEINRQLTRKYDLRSPYEIRLVTENGNKKREDNARLRMPVVSNLSTLGISTVAELCKKIERKFGAKSGVGVKVWDSHNESYVAGQTSYSRVRI